MNDKLKVLDLFSGIGGFSLGLERTCGFETVAFCEIEEYPQKVLAKHWPNVPIFDDVRKLDATGLGRIDCVVGGFPCQPWSLAGKRKGTEDNRDLWPEMLRVITDAQPQWVIGENVRGFINEPMGLERSISDLENAGYKVQSFVIPACGVDAPHRRDRVWIIAHRDNAEQCDGERTIRQGRGNNTGGVCETKPDTSLENTGHRRGRDVGATKGRQRLSGERASDTSAPSRPSEQREALANAMQLTMEGNGESGEQVSDLRQCDKQIEGGQTPIRERRYWAAEPGLGRVANGVPNRSHRLKGLGNAVVPQIPEMIGRAILEAEKQNRG